jgi:plasmid maintenance system antidote protein VapI
MKAIVKLLAEGMKNRDHAQVINDLAIPADDFKLVLSGDMEISPRLAMTLEQVLGIDAHDILSAQSADQLATLGKARTKKVEVPVETKAQKPARTDGQPKQSPMYRGPRSVGAVAIKL